jgi:hypothetical protein
MLIYMVGAKKGPLFRSPELAHKGTMESSMSDGLAFTCIRAALRNVLCRESFPLRPTKHRVSS